MLDKPLYLTFRISTANTILKSQHNAPLILFPPPGRPPLPRITRRTHQNPFFPIVHRLHPRPRTRDRPLHLQLALPLLPRLRRGVLGGNILRRRGGRHVRLERRQRHADFCGQSSGGRRAGLAEVGRGAGMGRLRRGWLLGELGGGAGVGGQG